MPEARAQPHAAHRGALVEDDGYAGVRSPVRLFATPGIPGNEPPVFARDTRTLLRECGYDGEDIARLIRSGAVPGVSW